MQFMNIKPGVMRT